MTQNEVSQAVADSIRAVAEQVIASADEYAVGMDDATGLRILLDFQLNCLPTITVQKDISCGRTIADKRCRIWTRWNEDKEREVYNKHIDVNGPSF